MHTLFKQKTACLNPPVPHVLNIPLQTLHYVRGHYYDYYLLYLTLYLLKSNATILHVILKHYFSEMPLLLHLAVDAKKARLFKSTKSSVIG